MSRSPVALPLPSPPPPAGSVPDEPDPDVTGQIRVVVQSGEASDAAVRKQVDSTRESLRLLQRKLSPPKGIAAVRKK